MGFHKLGGGSYNEGCSILWAFVRQSWVSGNYHIVLTLREKDLSGSRSIPLGGSVMSLCICYRGSYLCAGKIQAAHDLQPNHPKP